MSRDYAAIALDYCRDIVSGEIVSAKEVQEACQRHLDDLKRQCRADFPYRFDAEAGNRVCRFAELFKITDGPLAGQPVVLMPWQCFIYVSLYGWLAHGGIRDGKRRFRRAYICMPRGNSKSTTCAFLLLYMLAFDGEGGAQVVTAGATKSVADISYGAAKTFINSKPSLLKKKGIIVQSRETKHPASNSKMWSAPALVKASDGKNIHFCVFDELHSLKDRAIYDSLKTALSKRNNNLFLMITTAGDDTSTVCYEQHQYMQGILDGRYDVEAQFGIIYHLPDGYDWRDPVGIQAANPGWGVTVMPDMTMQELQQAQLTPGASNNFKTKYLCEWVSAGGAWMDMEQWKKCRDTEMKIEDFEGEECIIGLDLASRIDIAGKIYLFTKMIDGEKHYYAFTKSYISDYGVDKGKNASYKTWKAQGHLTVHEGDRTSLRTIEAELIEDSKRFKVLEVAYDPVKADQMVEGLQDARIEVVPVGQNVMHLSEPMKEFQALIYDGKFHHNCPVFDWMVGNVFVEEDRNGNIYPRKQRNENKIDLVFATLNALARELFLENGAYNNQGIVFA